LGRMTEKPTAGASSGLMHVAAPTARDYGETGNGLCVHGFGREGP
jgi:hypothetical protein